MAITPVEALGSKMEIEKQKVEQFEAKCEDELRKRFDARSRVSVDIGNLNSFIVAIVQERFEAAGWVVTRFSSRDDESLVFSTPKIEGLLNANGRFE